MEELLGALLGLALIAIAVFVGWFVKLRAEKNKLHAARDAAERMATEREQALLALQERHNRIFSELAVLQQTHAAILNRFRGIVDAESERQRVLTQLEADRSRLQREIDRSTVEWGQALRDVQEQHLTTGTELEKLRQAHAALNDVHVGLVAAEREKRDAVERLASQQAQLQNELHVMSERLGRVAATEQEKQRVVAQLDADRTRLHGEVTHAKAQWEQTLQGLQGRFQQGTTEWASLQANIAKLRDEQSALDEESNLRSFGFYRPRYDFSTSDIYQGKLEQIRDRQKQMLKDKSAALCRTLWTVNGSATEGRKQVSQTLKLILRAFNGESDAAIAKVSYKNANVMESRIKKSWEVINGLVGVQDCEITKAYLDLKLQELYLAHEYQEKVQAEKEEQRRIREQMREEEVAQRELEKARMEAEREELRYEEALRKAQEEVEKAAGAKQLKLQSQIEALQKKLEEAHANKERAISRAQLTRSGHVYVISNIGSFGEQVYKIGMTRRLDPFDRVHELGDASVPFEFDVHAMIYSDDAPALENALHRAFHQQRINLINEKKEFFQVDIDEIARIVRRMHGEIEITRVAEAEQYRKTVAMRQEREAAQQASSPARQAPQAPPQAQPLAAYAPA
ncbi:DUF4041 domain-containing protein [Sorangium cellulosum]|uniref:Bacteriophage T5 Orf172 DNA-binding domain-containing protein n=1 Tax=Sorangium cellulosum TaxID=56 RepID=A0A150QAA5_SORCE|nr:DUF4041 domain-containing protein [Sorangium cellulosum]KYF64812.1 hypothetical protein BE15_24220 [Sorangium cellulosum]